MPGVRLTPNRQIALRWLDKNGAWRVCLTPVAPKLRSLEKVTPGLVEKRYYEDQDAFAWRLNDVGIALRKELFGDDA